MPNPTAPLDAASIRKNVVDTRFADIRYVAQTESTNLDAQELLGDQAALGTTLVAEYQSAGAGRKGRRWFAPPGSALLFTVILPAKIPAAALWAVPFWVALGVADAVESAIGISLDLVWPNDVHARGGKVAGILSVARIAGDDAWAGCGVGMNVIRPFRDAELDALDPPPVFLSDLCAQVERETLLATLLRGLDRSFEALVYPDRIATAWETRAALRGTIYRYYRDGEGGTEREGIAQRLGPHGSLIVRDAEGDHGIDMADVRVTGRLR